MVAIRHGVAVVAAATTALLSACSSDLLRNGGPSESPIATRPSLPTSVTLPTPEACSLTNLIAPGVTYTLYSKPRDTTIAVVYAAYRNDCARRVVVSGHPKPGNDAGLRLDDVIVSLMPASTSLESIQLWQAAEGRMLGSSPSGPTRAANPGELIVVRGIVSVGTVPTLTLLPPAQIKVEWEAGTAEDVDLASGTSVCNCALPPGA